MISRCEQEREYMMRITAAVFVALAVLVVPLGLAATASAVTTDTNRNVTPRVIGPIPTDRFGGGMMVGARAGQTTFGVFYGTSDHPNNVVIFAEETRILGGAEIVDGSGQRLATRGIPVQTVLAQSLNRFIEFNTTNASAGINLVPDYSGLAVSIPVKTLNLNTAGWTLSHMDYTTVGNMTTIDLNVTATDLRYTWVSPLYNGSAEGGDGMLNPVRFRFQHGDELHRPADLHPRPDRVRRPMDAHRPLRLVIERDGGRRPGADAVPSPRWDPTHREPRRRDLPGLRGPGRVPVSGGPVDHPRPPDERGVVRADHRVGFQPDAVRHPADPGRGCRGRPHPRALPAHPGATHAEVSGPSPPFPFFSPPNDVSIMTSATLPHRVNDVPPPDSVAPRTAI